MASPAPPADDYLEHIEKAMQAHLKDGPEAGGAALPVCKQRADRLGRLSVPLLPVGGARRVLREVS